MYAHIKESDLLNFQLLNYENLSKKEIEKRFSGRVALDMAILEVLGYKKGEINDILPKLYEVVLRELKQDF